MRSLYIIAQQYCLIVRALGPALKVFIRVITQFSWIIFEMFFRCFKAAFISSHVFGVTHRRVWVVGPVCPPGPLNHSPAWVRNNRQTWRIDRSSVLESDVDFHWNKWMFWYCSCIGTLWLFFCEAFLWRFCIGFTSLHRCNKCRIYNSTDICLNSPEDS